uniref:hypothetical protein n=1 Tax=Eubacterium sp. TaxID=142586 RepID=UPI003FEE01DC
MNAKELLTAIQISGKSVSDNRRDLQTYINIKNKDGKKDTLINYDYLIQELQIASDRLTTNYQN